MAFGARNKGISIFEREESYVIGYELAKTHGNLVDILLGVNDVKT